MDFGYAGSHSPALPACQQQIAKCDQQIAKHLATLTDKSGGTAPPVQKRVRAKRRNESGFDTRAGRRRLKNKA